MIIDPVLEAILDLARWAPSGDNTQPWRFAIQDARRLVVHGFDTRSHCVYDLDGHPSQISLGALLESMALAAGQHGLGMRAARRADAPEQTPTFDVAFAPRAAAPEPLAAVMGERSGQRRPRSARALAGLVSPSFSRTPAASCSNASSSMNPSTCAQ